MEITLMNNTFTLFARKYGSLVEQDKLLREFKGLFVRLETLMLCVDGEYDKRNGNAYLKATCADKSKSIVVSKTECFEFLWSGFVAACNWLDERRKEYICKFL